ncbi:type II secretion system F family protein [Leeia sp. TBRC 13508]|uniref:Type II secretion system F family protein n=1 Tax=Leeia speluncae TaxID=2884804 RepID=A0ABS8D677_9NEIS|nr:type II secretion system F family protein [Leeia speluncae]MCB6183681.1 type II secretion system F family protein [Leeia speluncae]
MSSELYRFRAMDEHGRICKGSLFAIDTNDLTNQLAIKGLDLLSYRKRLRTARTPLNRLFEKVSINDFFFHLHSLLVSGYPIIEALALLGEQFETQVALRKKVFLLKAGVESGLAFSAAFEKSFGLGSPSINCLLKIGELSGRLPEVLAQCIALENHRKNQRQRVLSVLFYPLLTSLILLVAIGIIISNVVPQLTTLLIMENQSVPSDLLLLLTFSDFVKAHLVAVLTASISLFILLAMGVLSPKGRRILHGLALNLPLLKGYLYHKQWLQSCYTLHLLYISGVPIFDALEAISESAELDGVREQLLQAKQEIASGGRFSRCFASALSLPSVYERYLSIGESSGTLDLSLQQIIALQENQIKKTETRWLAWLQPLIFMALALVMIWICFSVFGVLYMQVDPSR